MKQLFDDAKSASEFDLILTLMNYRGISSSNLNSNLHEWFDALDFYKRLYSTLEGKEKARIGLQLYSTFFENSDFYNIVGSLCRITMGYKGSSYLFWKTKKYERLLGIGEKQDFLMELLVDANRMDIAGFYEQNHFKEIRNTFFHSAYSIEGDDYVMHDSDPIEVDGVKRSYFSLTEFFYPKLEAVIEVFESFKSSYLGHFKSYQKDKMITGNFPSPSEITILGSKEGLKGFRIKNSVQFFGKWHDSGIWFDEQYGLWTGYNIRMYTARIEDIEIDEQIARYEGKADITKNNADFFNLIDKIKERNNPGELRRATILLLKYGDVRMDKMEAEENPFKKKSFPKIVLPYYSKALEVGEGWLKDVDAFKKTILELEEQI